MLSNETLNGDFAFSCYLMYYRTVYNIIPFGIQNFIWNSDISLLSVCLVIDNMCVPTSAIYWIESSLKILHPVLIYWKAIKKKAYCAGHDLRYNVSFSCLSVSRVQTNTVSCNGTKVPSKL